MSDPLRPAARADIVLRPMGPEWVLYDPDTRDLHVLNTSAALTWSLLDGERSLDQVALEVAADMQDAPGPEELRVDVAAAVERFRAAGLLA